MKQSYIIFILFIMISANSYAQITINAHKDPEPFSIVQVEGDKSGVRLPRMTTEQMTDLAPTLTGNDEANGLVVYNETSNQIEFWDGTEWIAMKETVAANGITFSSPAVELGGNLTEPTEIDMKTFDLDFTHTTGGEFSVNGNTIKDREVSIIPGNNFTVNNGAMDVTGGNIAMNTEKLAVNTDAFVMEEGTTIKGTFGYTHSSLEEGYLLSSDASGNAVWDGLRPFGTIIKGKLNDNTPFANGDEDITIDPLVLEPGQWIIFAKCTATATGTGSGTFMYHWLKLINYTGTGENDFGLVAQAGINPELISTAGTAYSCPSLVYFVDINTTTTYGVRLGTSNNLNDRTISGNGGSYFYAVRIDVANP